jgi:hypothetical protein
MNILKLTKSVFTGMLLGMNLNTIWTHGKETILIFAEVDDKLFRVEGTVGWLHERNKDE